MNKKTTSSSGSLDQFDLHILDLLQSNNLMPQRDIAVEVNLSPAAVNRRIKRMQNNGTIQYNFSVLNPDQINNPISLIVGVELKDEQANLIAETKKQFSAYPEVQQCYYVTGETDFMLIITVSTMAAYEQLTQQLFFTNGNIKRFKTYVVMDRVKIGLSFPLNNCSKATQEHLVVK